MLAAAAVMLLDAVLVWVREVRPGDTLSGMAGD